jgi:hypothetical protein
MRNLSKKEAGPAPEFDDTEIVLAQISEDFRKVIQSKALRKKKIIKLALKNEMSHVPENMERLIHGKA